MKIAFTGRKTDLTDSLKLFTEKKLAKLERILGPDTEAHVVLTLEKRRQRAEIVVKARTVTLTARADAADFLDSVTGSVERLLAQAKKHRGRLTKRSRREGARHPKRGAAVVEAGILAGAERSGKGSDGDAVVRMGRVPVKPMTVEEAVLLARQARDAFFVFRDAESLQIAVIFRRADGRLGVVEAEA